MQRLTLALLALILITIPAIRALGGRQDRGLVYSVEEVTAQLERNPAAWVGRDVHIRAVAEPCPAWGSPHSPLHCKSSRPILADPDGADLSEPLPLVVNPESPLLAFVRTLPLPAWLAPPPATPTWERVRTYRVRLRPTAVQGCGAARCFEALLLAIER